MQSGRLSTTLIFLLILYQDCYFTFLRDISRIGSDGTTTVIKKFTEDPYIVPVYVCCNNN